MKNNKPEVLTTDNEKNNHYNTIVPFVNEADNQLRFKSPAAMLTSLNGHYGQWTSTWKLFQSVDTCTHTVIMLKNKSEELIDADIDDIYNEITPSVFTDEDNAVFLVYPRKPKSPAVVSEIAPGLIFDSLGHLWAKVRFNNTASPTSKAAPRGNFVFYEQYIGLPSIEPALIPFGKGNISTSSSHQFIFTEAEVGKTMYVRCFYQITKGNRSPASVIISFQIS